MHTVYQKPENKRFISTQFAASFHAFDKNNSFNIKDLLDILKK